MPVLAKQFMRVYVPGIGACCARHEQGTLSHCCKLTRVAGSGLHEWPCTQAPEQKAVQHTMQCTVIGSACNSSRSGGHTRGSAGQQRESQG